MNKVLELYSFIDTYYLEVNKIIKLPEEDFINDERVILMGYAILEGIEERLIKVHEIISLSSNKLNLMSKQIYRFNKLVSNSYKLINGYMIYDFLKNDYNVLYDEVKKIVKGS